MLYGFYTVGLLWAVLPTAMFIAILRLDRKSLPSRPNDLVFGRYDGKMRASQGPERRTNNSPRKRFWSPASSALARLTSEDTMKLSDLRKLVANQPAAHDDYEVKVWLPGSKITICGPTGEAPKEFMLRHDARLLMLEGNVDAGSALDA